MTTARTGKDNFVSADENEKTALVPLQERSVDFYGDQVLAVLVEEHGEQQVYVPLRPIADYLGLAWSSQLQRLRRDPILNESLRGVFVTNTPGIGGGTQEVKALPLKFLPGWLFGISAKRVRTDLQEKVLRYQRECYDVLWRAFQAEAHATTGSLARQPQTPAMATLAQVREMGLAIVALAEQQMVQEAKLASHDVRLEVVEQRLDKAAAVVASLQRRVQPAAVISDEQAAEISGQVKALAELMMANDPSTAQAGQALGSHPIGGQRRSGSQNHYQGIFTELYRRFGVSSYKLIRQDQYTAVLQFLDDWRKSLG